MNPTPEEIAALRKCAEALKPFAGVFKDPLVSSPEWLVAPVLRLRLFQNAVKAIQELEKLTPAEDPNQMALPMGHLCGHQKCTKTEDGCFCESCGVELHFSDVTRNWEA